MRLIYAYHPNGHNAIIACNSYESLLWHLEMDGDPFDAIFTLPTAMHLSVSQDGSYSDALGLSEDIKDPKVKWLKFKPEWDKKCACGLPWDNTATQKAKSPFVSA